jgi:hypothetical protein
MHFFVMVGFATFIAIVFASVTSEVATARERVLYGLRVFGAFAGIGLAIAFLLYLLQR